MKQIRGITLLEVITVLVLCALLAALILPMTQRARTPARRTVCASNLRQILVALYLYADSPSSGGTLPTLGPKSDPFAQKEPAVEGLHLLYGQYISDPRIFACPSDPNKPSPAILQALSQWPTDGTKPAIRMTFAHTSYAYDPGHSTNISSMVALVADRPGLNGNSDNHGPSAGQNVGFGTSVEFRETVRNPLGDDKSDNNIFWLGDVTGGTTGTDRNEDSYLRQ